MATLRSYVDDFPIWIIFQKNTRSTALFRQRSMRMKERTMNILFSQDHRFRKLPILRNRLLKLKRRFHICLLLSMDSLCRSKGFWKCCSTTPGASPRSSRVSCSSATAFESVLASCDAHASSTGESVCSSTVSWRVFKEVFIQNLNVLFKFVDRVTLFY